MSEKIAANGIRIQFIISNFELNIPIGSGGFLDCRLGIELPFPGL